MSVNKVVLITGCSSGGIGYDLCEQFAEQGCKVYATARNIKKITAFGCTDIESRIERRALDVTREEDVQGVVEEIMEKEGRIDIVVNNAGFQISGAIIDLTIENDQEIFETNVISVLRVCKAVVPVMAKRKSGLIINIGSILGEISPPWSGVYAASKAALHSLTTTLYMECKPFHINVMLITTGAVSSHLFTDQTTNFTMPPDSLYCTYYDRIVEYIKTSAGIVMPADQYAKKVVQEALKRKPRLFVRSGAHNGLWYFLTWMPRVWVLNKLWLKLTEYKRS